MPALCTSSLLNPRWSSNHGLPTGSLSSLSSQPRPSPISQHLSYHLGMIYLESRPAQLGDPRSPPAGTTIDLHVALKPHDENALIDALYEGRMTPLFSVRSVMHPPWRCTHKCEPSCRRRTSPLRHSVVDTAEAPIGGTADMAPRPAVTPADVYIAWFNNVFDLEDVPQTIGISYGDNENNVPLEYASALCNLFAKLGARGASVICPSGNVLGVGKGDDKDSSGRVQFTPNFPAHPYTVAGASHSPPPSRHGFAGLYITNHLGSQYDGLYNAADRGIPNISTQPFKFSIVLKDEECCMGDTSWQHHWLNRWLYWFYDDGLQGFYDVTSASGFCPGCGTDGFSAIARWDPVRPADLFIFDVG
ncbi:hypothetical protein EDB83DRAFT_2311905 [Lactarius deliciosus]|nr:hypothetical protein EDB83DRAFT_2311905 [Lactarius deliciosus]